MRVHCAVTHFDEITLEHCLHRIKLQSRQPDQTTIVAGVSPANVAFNRAVEVALAERADVLIHLAADVIVDQLAFQHLLASYDSAKHYAVVARGFDIFNGSDAPMGLWALNVAAVSEIRFRDVYKMDLDFCERVEAATGLQRTRTSPQLSLGYHHPIWLPSELFKKFRYNTAKYRRKEISKYLEFFEQALAVNPDNKALLAGQIGLKRGAAEPPPSGAPDRETFDSEWQDVAELLGVEGGEFFAYHQDFVDLGYRLVGSKQHLVPMKEHFFPPVASQNSLAVPPKKDPVRHMPTNIKLSIKRFLKPAYDKSPRLVQDMARLLLGKPPISRSIRLISTKAEPVTEYGSSRLGRGDWAAKWQTTAKKNRILMVAPKDFAGSMYKWAEAVNLHTDFAVRLVIFEEHQYSYPIDLVVPECNGKRFEAVLSLADEAAILHLKDEHSWYMALPQFLNLHVLDRLFFSSEFASKPKVFTHYGGYARKFKAEKDYIGRVGRFDLRIAMTPDLNYEWFDGQYIPHAIDTDQNAFEWADTRVFAHSPSSREKKGTHYLEEAWLHLKAKHTDVWRDWSLDLIHGVSFKECMTRKRRACLFFDQAGRHSVSALGIDDIIGWYGNSAIEAMAFGIPTIAHLSELAFEGAERAGVFIRNNPIINIQPSRESMVRAFLEFATAPVEKRADLAAATRNYVVDFHGYRAVAGRLAECYARLTDNTHGSTDDARHEKRVSFSV